MNGDDDDVIPPALWDFPFLHISSINLCMFHYCSFTIFLSSGISSPQGVLLFFSLLSAFSISSIFEDSVWSSARWYILSSSLFIRFVCYQLVLFVFNHVFYNQSEIRSDFWDISIRCSSSLNL